MGTMSKYSPEGLSKARTEYLANLSAQRRANFLDAERTWQNIQGLPYKACGRCKTPLRLEAYNLKRRETKERSSYCRSCSRLSDFIYTRDPEVIMMRRERQQLWRERHPGLSEAHNMRYRFISRRKDLGLPIGNPLSTITFYGMIALYGNICFYCDQPLDISDRSTVSIDHVIPLVHKDSTHDWSNVLPAHRFSCNTSKYDRALDDFVGPMRAEEIRGIIKAAEPRYAQADLYAF